MRFGIALCADGPLAEPDAVAAAGRAAEALGYASVWASSLRQLAEVAGGTERVPLGLLLPERDGLRVGADDLGERLAYVAAQEPELTDLWGVLPTCRLLDASDVAPESDRVDGWAPRATGSMVLPAAWRAADPLRLLVLRVSGPPTEFDLRSAAVVGVDELVVALPAAVTLDEQLATFADIAEGLPTPVRPPG